jgi:NAD(P)-dependent dehydrogenase (short-subunit alcohol dehydrogenase family)
MTGDPWAATVATRSPLGFTQRRCYTPFDAGYGLREARMQLEGKRALITGAAQGIGKSTALAFAQEGAVLALLDLNGPGATAAAKECESLGATASAFTCDMTDEAEVEATFGAARQAMGGIDIVVNTAAWLDPPIPVHEMPKDVWDRSITTDLTTVYLGC